MLGSNSVKIAKLLILSSVIFICSACTSSDVNHRKVGNMIMEDIPEIPTRISEQTLKYRNNRGAGFAGWNNQGNGIFIRTRFADTVQLHYVESPGAARQQLTFFEEPIGHITTCPDPKSNLLLFTKDTGGNENDQVFSFNTKTGDYKIITEGSGITNGLLFSDDGKTLAFRSTKRNNRDWDIYISQTDNLEQSKLILQKQGSWYPMDFSPDGSKLLIGNWISVNESYVYIYDLQNNELTQFNPSENPISYHGAAFASNGKDIYFISNQNCEFHCLWHYCDKTRNITNISESIGWEVSDFVSSQDRDKFVFTTNQNGSSYLYTLDMDNNSYKQVKKMPVGIIHGISFHPTENKLAFTLCRPTRPSDAYVYDFSNQSLKQWTLSEIGGLNPDNFVEPKLIEYPTFDKVNGQPRNIPAYYYTPKTPGPWPVIINIHGGPEAQYRPYYSTQIQYWVNEMDIAVIAPNVRGSDGYGKTYINLDNGYLREDSVKDIGSLLDWIDTQNQLDSNKVAVCGGSYGGYMVLASLTNYPDRIKCGIDIVGISNFVTFLNNTKEYRRDLRRVEYGDERDEQMKKFLMEISPTTNAHKIKSSLFVVQGLNDPRVPATEAEQIVKQVRKNGQTVWYMLAEDEGHGFRKKQNSNMYRDAAVLFLETNLLND